MTFLDPIRRAHNAPSRPVNRAQERRNRINPDLPRPGEDFSSYVRRAGTAPELADASRGPRQALRQQDRELARRASRINDTLRDPIASRGLSHSLGQALVDAQNTASTRLLDIPMGQYLLGPSRKNPSRDLDPGRAPASGFEIRRDGRIGIISWGTDLRRDLSEIFGDVERIAGGPAGYLERLARHESGSRVDATPGTSSATGYFQVIDSTWRRVVENPIFQTAYQLPPLDRRELMDYRGDARIDGAIAIELARDSYDWLRRNGVQAPTEQHLYMGHFGGESGLRMAADRARSGRFTRQHGAEYFTPAQIAANEPIFFHPKRDAAGNVLYRTVERDGQTVRIQVADRARPYTSDEVWARLTDGFADRPVSFAPRATGIDGTLSAAAASGPVR